MASFGSLNVFKRSFLKSLLNMASGTAHRQFMLPAFLPPTLFMGYTFFFFCLSHLFVVGNCTFMDIDSTFPLWGFILLLFAYLFVSWPGLTIVVKSVSPA